jgi:hypothetical protein
MSHIRGEGGPRAIQAAERKADAINLRMAGASYQEIADQLGYADHTGARKAVLTAMSMKVIEPVKLMRRLELYRLDELQSAVYPRAMEGDLKALGAVLKIMERRAALMGLDSPKKVNINAYAYNMAKQHGLSDEDARAAASMAQELATQMENDPSNLLQIPQAFLDMDDL